MKVSILIVLAILLAACGPREIGEGSTAEASNPPGATGADMLRLPMSGANNTQKLLYWVNHPDVVQNIQNWRREKFYKSLGIAPNPEDPAYREVPKQKSPFRQ